MEESSVSRVIVNYIEQLKKSNGLSEYEGKWIVITAKPEPKIVSSSETLEEATEIAFSRGFKRDYLGSYHVPEKSPYEDWPGIF